MSGKWLTPLTTHHSQKEFLMSLEHPLVIAILTLLVALAVYLVVLFLAAKGSFERIRLALRCELRTLRDASFAAKVKTLLTPPMPKAAAKLSGAPLRLLAVLQREGRLPD